MTKFFLSFYLSNNIVSKLERWIVSKFHYGIKGHILIIGGIIFQTNQISDCLKMYKHGAELNAIFEGKCSVLNAEKSVISHFTVYLLQNLLLH